MNSYLVRPPSARRANCCQLLKVPLRLGMTAQQERAAEMARQRAERAANMARQHAEMDRQREARLAHMAEEREKRAEQARGNSS